MRAGKSPASAGAVVHFSSTSSLSIGAAWMSSSTLRAPSGPRSGRNGGFEVASAISCAAGSKMWLLIGLPFCVVAFGDRAAGESVTRTALAITAGGAHDGRVAGGDGPGGSKYGGGSRGGRDGLPKRATAAVRDRISDAQQRHRGRGPGAGRVAAVADVRPQPGAEPG